jgi:hypothetical protein
LLLVFCFPRPWDFRSPSLYSFQSRVINAEAFTGFGFLLAWDGALWILLSLNVTFDVGVQHGLVDSMNWVLWFDANHAPRVDAAILVGSVAIAAIGAAIILRRREDGGALAGYRYRIVGRWSRLAGLDTLVWPRRIVMPRNDRMLARAKIWGKIACGVDIRRILFFTAGFVIVPWVLDSGESGAKLFFELWCPWASIVTAGVIVSSWVRSSRFFAADILRPVERERFFREMNLGMAISFARVWAIMAIAALVEAELAGGAVVSGGTLVGGVVATFIISLLGWGASIFLMRYGWGDWALAPPQGTDLSG